MLHYERRGRVISPAATETQLSRCPGEERYSSYLECEGNTDTKPGLSSLCINGRKYFVHLLWLVCWRSFTIWPVAYRLTFRHNMLPWRLADTGCQSYVKHAFCKMIQRNKLNISLCIVEFQVWEKQAAGFQYFDMCRLHLSILGQSD